jgi:hypothetical protein
VLPRQFESEVCYNVAPVWFLEHLWDSVALATVNGKIYKIAPCAVTYDLMEAEAIVKDVVLFWALKQLPQPSIKSNSLVWDAADGNVVFNQFKIGDECQIHLFLTSRAIRQFRRLHNAFAPAAQLICSDCTAPILSNANFCTN